MSADISLTLCEAPDFEDGIIRIDVADIHALGLAPGDVVAVEGARKTYLSVHPAFMEDRNQHLARLSPLALRNTGLLPGHVARILPERTHPPVAELVLLETPDDLDRLHVQARQQQLSHFWRGRPLVVEDALRIPTLDRHPLIAKVVSTQPSGVVQVGAGTVFNVSTRRNESDLPKVGGLRDIYRTCQILVERHFRKHVEGSAQSILLHGPAGCGKASLVARLAKEAGVALRVFDAHGLIDQWLAHQSSELAVSLSELARRGPTVILLDHMEALEIPEGTSSAMSVAAHSVMAEICALLDEVPTQPNIMVFTTSSAPLTARLDGNRRFDLRLPVDSPNRWGRHEILLLACAGSALADDVDLSALASMTPGATGRDIKNLVSTARLLSEGPKLSERDLFSALRGMAPSAAAEVRCEIPTTSWDEVAGLDDIKSMLCDTISWSLQLYEKFAAAGVRPPRSVLLSGGQGTGKTSLVRSMAAFMPVNFIEVNCPILSARTPESAAAFLRESFALARRKAPCLVFFDDVDVLFEPTESETEIVPHHHPIVSQLIADLDSLGNLPGVVVIAATNRPDRLTAEILRPGRFDFAVTLPLPDVAARKKVLQIHARKLPLASDIDFDRLAATTQGMSPAEIATLCNRVGMMALRRSLASGEGGVIPPIVNAELFEQALRGRKN